MSSERLAIGEQILVKFTNGDARRAIRGRMTPGEFDRLQRRKSERALKKKLKKEKGGK